MAEKFNEILEEEKKKLEAMEARIRAQADQIVSKSNELRVKEESLKKLGRTEPNIGGDRKKLKDMEARINAQANQIKNKDKELVTKEQSLNELEKKLRQAKHKIHDYGRSIDEQFGKDGYKAIKIEEEKARAELELAKKQRQTAESKFKKIVEEIGKAERKEKESGLRLELLRKEKEKLNLDNSLSDLTKKRDLLLKEKNKIIDEKLRIENERKRTELLMKDRRKKLEKAGDYFKNIQKENSMLEKEKSELKKELEILKEQQFSSIKAVNKTKELLKKNIRNLDKLKGMKKKFDEQMKEDKNNLYLANVEIVKKMREIQTERNRIEKDKKEELKRKKLLAEEKIKLAEERMKAAREELEFAKDLREDDNKKIIVQ